MTGYEMTRGQNDRDEMTGDEMKGDESQGNHIKWAQRCLTLLIKLDT
jgi:hypothetical protein